MGMLMRMRYRVGVRAAVMRMGKRVLVEMGMLPDQGIRNAQCRPCDHNRQSDQVHPGQTFPQKNKG